MKRSGDGDGDDDDDDDEEAMDMEAFEQSGMLDEEDNVHSPELFLTMLQCVVLTQL